MASSAGRFSDLAPKAIVKITCNKCTQRKSTCTTRYKQLTRLYNIAMWKGNIPNIACAIAAVSHEGCHTARLINESLAPALLLAVSMSFTLASSGSMTLIQSSHSVGKNLQIHNTGNNMQNEPKMQSSHFLRLTHTNCLVFICVASSLTAVLGGQSLTSKWVVRSASVIFCTMSTCSAQTKHAKQCDQRQTNTPFQT